MISPIKHIQQKYDGIDNFIYLFGIFIIFSIVTPSYKKIAYFILCIAGIIILFTLDCLFGIKIEGKSSDKKLCIDADRFNQDSHKEIGRYTENCVYYNNTWRICLLISLILSLFIVKFIPDTYIGYMPYVIIVLFCVIYHCLKWKIHHSYDFIFKTIRDACKQREHNQTEPYQHHIHI